MAEKTRTHPEAPTYQHRNRITGLILCVLEVYITVLMNLHNIAESARLSKLDTSVSCTTGSLVFTKFSDEITNCFRRHLRTLCADESVRRQRAARLLTGVNAEGTTHPARWKCTNTSSNNWNHLSRKTSPFVTVKPSFTPRQVSNNSEHKI